MKTRKVKGYCHAFKDVKAKYCSLVVARFDASCLATRNGEAMGVFRCPHCKSWHLGKGPAGDGRVAEAAP